MAIGQSIVTADGINALANASSSGASVKPKYFKFSNQNLTLDPQMRASDISGWVTQDIDVYQVINDDTIEFVCDVAPESATDYARIAGLYLDDGTLFMVAKPPYPFPPTLRQTFKIQLAYNNATGLMDFQYVPFSEEEQSLSILDTSVTLGLQQIENSKEIGLLKSKIGVK